MKNSFNLGFVVLVFAVIGCSCPKLNELSQKGGNSGTPSGSPTLSNTTRAASPTPSAGTLSIDKYNQIKTGMTRSEVENLLGGSGTEFSSTTGGGVTFASYKWEGENFKTIFITFRDDKVLSKSQVGLK
jgi:hypothetical protein